MRWRMLAGGLAALAAALAAAGCSAPLSHGKAKPACQAGLPRLRDELYQLDRTLATERRKSKTMAARLPPVSAALKAIDRKYPSRQLPPPVYKQYVALQHRYNELYRAYSKQVDRTNGAIARRNRMATRYNRTLRCTD